MSGSAQRIVSQFEELGLSPEEIASQEGIDILVVKAALVAHSSVYRTQQSSLEASGPNTFSSEEEDLAKRVLVELLNSDDEHIKLKAAKYVRDDKRGRLDPIKALQSTNITVFQFNQTVERAKRARELSRAKNNVAVNIEAQVINTEVGEKVTA